MARSNTGSASNWLSTANPPVTALPCTMACWFNVANATSFFDLMTLSQGGAGNKYLVLGIDGTAGGKPVEAIGQDTSGSEAIASTTSPISAGTWQHGCAVFAAANDYRAYLNGGSKGTQSSLSRNPTTIDYLAVGAGRFSGSMFSPLNGSIAEAAVWNVALTDDEVAALGKGVSPLLIRPASLVSYWPLLGRYSPEIDIKGGNALTINGAMPAAVHPRTLGSRPVRLAPTAAATSGTSLIIGDATQARSADVATLTQTQLLAIADATHARAADAATLSQTQLLAIADATQARAADAATLAQTQLLAVDDATQARAADAATVSQAQALLPDDATQARTTDAATLTQTQLLAADDAVQARAADAAGLAQDQHLAADDATQARAADGATVSVAFALAPDDAVHARTADLARLVQSQILVPAEAQHARTADLAALVQSQILVVDDAAQGRAADAGLVVSLVATPALDRVIRAAAENRAIRAAAENRVIH